MGNDEGIVPHFQRGGESLEEQARAEGDPEESEGAVSDAAPEEADGKEVSAPAKEEGAQDYKDGINPHR